ncbi:MAG: alkaline phosphatase family protein [Cyclobacteriaceae bacterium]|nr:alkaline phosphatase family protein [Cyclobacteriaceae bacterium]
MRHLTIICLWCSLTLQAQQATQTENVFLITLDGLRWQELFSGADSSLIIDEDYVGDPEALQQLFWRDTEEQRRETLMPFFWHEIGVQGQLLGNRTLGSKVNCTNQQWFSYPGYNEILSGFADDQRINSNDKMPNPNKTVLEFLHNQEKFKGKVAAFGSWDVFPFIVNEERSGIPVNAGFEQNPSPPTPKEAFLDELQQQIPSPWSTVRFDAFTHHYAMEYLKKNTPRLLYIAYGETDDFAHEGHYDAYLKSAHQTDAFIKELWEFAQSHLQYRDKTTLIITTDHGRGTIPKETWRSHGAKIEGADEIWIAILGPDTEPLGEVNQDTQFYQNQVAATLSALLGVEYKGDKIGKTIDLAIEGGR